MEWYLLFGLGCSFCGWVGFIIFTGKLWKGKYNEKLLNEENYKKEKETEMENNHSIIKELQLKSSIHSMDIHKLYLENCELRSKLDKIYSNHLNENINYYKNIVLMNEKIEYMQKYMLQRCNLHTK